MKGGSDCKRAHLTVVGEGQSKFIILYHRTPFDEGKDETGKRIWIDQKSPNGIIPTLRNLFRSSENGTWIAWRRVEELDQSEDETIAMEDPAPFTLRRIPLNDTQISSFYHVTSKECFWPILHTFPTYFNVNNADWGIFEDVNHSSWCDGGRVFWIMHKPTETSGLPVHEVESIPRSNPDAPLAVAQP